MRAAALERSPVTHGADEYRAALVADQTRVVTASQGGRFTEADARMVAAGAAATVEVLREGGVIPCPGLRDLWCAICGAPPVTNQLARRSEPVKLHPTLARDAEWCSAGALENGR